MADHASPTFAADPTDAHDTADALVAPTTSAVVAAGILVAGSIVLGWGMTAEGQRLLPGGFITPVAIGAAGVLFGFDRLLRRLRPGLQTRLVLSILWLGLIVFAAVFADWLPLAEARDTGRTIDTPTLLRPDLLSGHPLGTDRHGLDVLGAVVHGARTSLIVGVGAVLVGIVVGGLGGLIAGYYRGRVEAVIAFAADAVLAFPPLIMLLALGSALEPSVTNVTLGLALLSVPIYVRIARANTMRHASAEYVEMARTLGATDRRILFRELMPNVLPSLIAYSTVIVAVLIVAEASLSYLGLSVQRPMPTWGNLIAAGEKSIRRDPHLVFVPGAVLLATVMALNTIGDRFQARDRDRTTG